MEADGSAEPAHELKRKRLDGPDDAQGTFGQTGDETLPHNLDGSTDSRIDSNGTKRMKMDDPNGHIKPDSRVEIPGDRSRLPGEIWQYIFTFLAPPTLTRLLAVNHKFKDLLSEGKSDDASSIGGYLKFLDSDFIWTASRRLFFPNMPRPLASRNELEMWRLVSGRTCQFCRKESPEPGYVPNQLWNGGPGTDGVRIIWPFGVRSCGKCLTTRMKKEMDVMFSSSIPSALLPALPFAFFTSTLDYVSPITVQANSPPPDITLSKFYYQDHLDAIKRKFEDVRALGGSTAEEWFKGLEGTGKDMLADALRWERWDAEGGISRVQAFRVAKPEVLPNLISFPEAQASAVVPPSISVPVQSNHAFQPAVSFFAGSQPMAAPPVPSQAYPIPSPASGGPFYPGYAPGVPQPAIQYGMGPPGTHPQSGHLPPKPMTPLVPMSSTVQYSTQFQPQYTQPRPMPINTPIQPHVPQPRAERSIRDVNDAKAQRRADIERRCIELDPPIKPSTLIHMESFAAAIQIPMALTDGAWEVLKPRLLAQKETAEEREREQLQQSQILQARTEERRQQEAALREAKENMDRQWDESQKPLRDKLNYYADEILKIKWGNGQLVTKENCPQFAADVLVYVRKRFYQILEWEDSVVQGGLPRQDYSASGSNRKLTLENMKWVYDTKVKPLTEPHSKEIFLCNGCDSGNKYYGFEGVIQHYAAKHTDVLSMGSIVVHWKADWPEDPPFDPDPSKTFTAAHQQYQGHHSPQYAYTQDGGNQVIKHDSPPNPQSYQQYSPSTIARPSYASSAPYQPSQYAMSPAPGSAHSVNFNTALQYSQQSGHVNASQPHNNQYPGHPWSPASHSTAETRPPLPVGSPQHFGTPHSVWPANQSSSSQQRPRPTPPARLGPPGQPFGIYQVQLEEVSKNAREIFDATAAVKDFPSSVRIYVIIAHVVVRFKDRFTNEPTLSLFTDALNNSSQMKPLRDLSDLACKACSIGTVDTSENKLYTLPALLTHFQSVHIEQARPAMMTQPGIESPRTDWKFDMVKLPSNAEVSKLMDAPGMTDTKLKLVASILPWAFPSPLPKIGYREPYIEPGMTGPRPAGGDTQYSAGPTSGGRHPQMGQRVAGSDGDTQSEAGPSSGLEVAVDDFPRFVESPAQDAAQALEPAGEDEYDPHRPAYREPTPASYSRFDHSKNRSKDSKPISTWPPVLFNGHQMGGEASIGDGRLAQASRVDQTQQQPSSQSQQQQRAQSISAAEQFLNNFDPNEDRDTYEPPEYVSPVLNAQHQSVRQYSPVEPVPPGVRHATWNEAPTYGTGNSWNRQGYEANQELRANSSAFNTQGSHGATPVDQDRYGQAGNENIYYVEHQPRRPSSRFSGYEPDRQASIRPRSRSPHANSSLPSANRYYRARSPLRDPAPAYGTQQLVRDREYYPQGEALQYAPETHRQQYPPERGYNEHVYDGSVEYIRMPPRESHGLPTYYVDHQPPAGGQYVQFDEPVFEHNGQLYRRSQIPPDAAVERQYYH